MNDYLELLSGFLINNFHGNDVYDDGVKEACAYFNNFPEYKEEMENVFEHILDNDFPENKLRDIVRKDANIFCSKDSNARTWLQNIYDDTILQKDRYQDEKELEKLLADLEDDVELEDELQFIPNKMSAEFIQNGTLNQFSNKLLDSLNKGKIIRAKKDLPNSEDLRMYLYIYKKKNVYQLDIEVINLKFLMGSEPIEEHGYVFDDLDKLSKHITDNYEMSMTDFIRI